MLFKIFKRKSEDNKLLKEETKNEISSRNQYSISSRGVIAIEYFVEEKYEECYELYNNSNLGLRPKDESILSIVCLYLKKYDDVIYYCNKLLSYTNKEWNNDRQLEKKALKIATKAKSFITNNFSDKLYDNDNKICSVANFDACKRANGLIEKAKKLGLYEMSPFELLSTNKLFEDVSVYEMSLNYYAFAEMCFRTENWVPAADAYLAAARLIPQTATFWAYFAQSILRSITKAPMRVEMTEDRIIEAYLAIQKAIEIEPENIEWRILYINVMMCMHTIGPVRYTKELINEYELAEKMPMTDARHQTQALTELGKILKMLGSK